MNKIALAAKAYRKWANIAIWDDKATNEVFENKIVELSIQYNVSVSEIKDMLTLMTDRLFAKVYQN